MNLKPCPFCGSTNLSTYDDREFVSCLDCSTDGPYACGGGSDASHAAWNRRSMNRAPAGMSEPYSEFEIWEGEADESLMSACTSGPRSVAWREARHYAAQYAQDGPVRICEVTRRWLHPEEIMSAAAPAMREPAPSSVDPAVPPSEEKK